VKCYSLLILFFFSFRLYGQPLNETVLDIDKVAPIDEVTIVNGEIYLVGIKSNKSNKELRAFKNTKINDVMYVMEFIELPDDELRRFKVFVTDPPTKKPGAKEEKKPFFAMVGFEYKPEKKAQSQDFLQIDIPYELSKTKGYFAYIIVFIFLILSIPLGLFVSRKVTIQKRKKMIKKMKKEKIKDLMNLIEDSQDRVSYEQVFLEKKNIIKLLNINREYFDDFIAELDSIQYQASWTEQEHLKLEKKYNMFKKSKVSSGI
jgi:hypothetical protein